MTRRERLERKAERRRDWAAGRTAKAGAAHARVSAIADRIPLGQPILVGHHSEGHARRDQARIHNGMRAAIEHREKAIDHDAKADGIERQLDCSIYSDDVDAAERLTERIAALEARRDRRKAVNRAVRAAKFASDADYLKAVLGDRCVNGLELTADEAKELEVNFRFSPSTAYGYQPYELTNLGARIRQAKKRLATVGQKPMPRLLVLKYKGECDTCGARLAAGVQAYWIERAVLRCEACFQPDIASA